MERATAGGGAGCRVIAPGAGRKTNQCRFPHCRLDPAGQHHDARAGLGATACGTAPAAIDTAGDRANAVAASDAGGIPCVGRGQKTAGSKVLAEARGSGSTYAGRSGARASSRGRQRLSLFKELRMIFGQTENRFPLFRIML